MYSIGHIIVGTYFVEAWDDDDRPLSDLLEKHHDMDIKDVVDDGPWTSLARRWRQCAYVGVELKEFDECGAFPYSDIAGLEPTPEQLRAARCLYEELPEFARELLPPFGVYIIWSTS